MGGFCVTPKEMERVVTVETLQHLVREVLTLVPKEGKKAAIVALRGELGAGKTTFMQALARELGILEPVQSPTYVLMKSYPISFERFTTLVHIDAYRLENPEEFAALNPSIFLDDPRALVCIEWPERLGNTLPQPDITLEFSGDGLPPGERQVKVL